MPTVPHQDPPIKSEQGFSLARRMLPWLALPAMLGSLVLGFLILRSSPLVLFGVISAIFLGGVLLWILASSLWPARADRLCPGCKQESLERIDAKTTMGVRCRACGYWDEGLSGWFLAEEEGPLEHLVLEQKHKQKRQSKARVSSRQRFGRNSSGKAGRS